MSPLLFNILLEKVISATNGRPDEGVKRQNSSIGLLAYADDLVLVEESPNAVKSLFGRLQKIKPKRSTYGRRQKGKLRVYNIPL